MRTAQQVTSLAVPVREGCRGRVENKYLPIAAELVTSTDFFHDHHKRIWKRILDMQARNVPIDLTMLYEDLKRVGDLEAAGGAGYLASLVDGVPRISNVASYAQIVKEKSLLRSLSHLGNYIQQTALEAEETPAVILERANLKLADLANIIQAQTKVAASETILADLPDTALDGRLGEISERRLKGLPRAYRWPAVVAAASVKVQPPSDIRTNVYTSLVGPVGSGKTQAIERAFATLGVGSPEVEPLMAGSGESLLKKLQDAAGQPRLISVDELSHLLEKSKIKSASFPALLNRAYYQTRFHLMVAAGKEIAVNCGLGLIGGIVDANFQDSFGSCTVYGLHDRFIWGLCPAPFSYAYRPFEGSPEEAEPKRIIVMPEIWEARDEWLRTMPGLTGRQAEHALRVAAICASWDGRQLLHPNNLGPTKAFLQYQVRVRLLLQPNPGENLDARCAFAITSHLEDAGWLSRRQLYRRINGSRFGPGAFDRACQTLEFNGEITSTPRGKATLVRLLDQSSI